ncbi:MAG: hypothetical protein WA208_07055 [Thermoanaerobaculia bacterium]
MKTPAELSGRDDSDNDRPSRAIPMVHFVHESSNVDEGARIERGSFEQKVLVAGDIVIGNNCLSAEQIRLADPALYRGGLAG